MLLPGISVRRLRIARLIEVTAKPISPEAIFARVKSPGSGCVVTYIGLIRARSHDRPVLSVEYIDSEGNAAAALAEMAREAKENWRVEEVAISHRTGTLMVGDINLVIAVASAHRSEGFEACQYLVDMFKRSLPTRKVETYRDTAGGSAEQLRET